MAGYLLDTCTISAWHNNNTAVVQQVELLPASDRLYFSTVSIGEIECGHARKSAVDPAKQAEFRTWIKKTFEDRLVYPDFGTAEIYGRFRAILFDKFPPTGKQKVAKCCDKFGDPMGVDENDLWLVAQAANHNLIFITTDQMSRIKEVCGSEVKIVVWPIT